MGGLEAHTGWGGRLRWALSAEERPSLSSPPDSADLAPVDRELGSPGWGKPAPPPASSGVPAWGKEPRRLRGNQKQIIFGIIALEPWQDRAHFS